MNPQKNYFGAFGSSHCNSEQKVGLSSVGLGASALILGLVVRGWVSTEHFLSPQTRQIGSRV